MSTQLSACCLSGHLHAGTPTGTETEVAGLQAYSTGDESSQKTLLFITDIFGYKLPNVRLLADEYAKAGKYRVVIPDFFDGDYVDAGHMKTLVPLRSDEKASEEKLQAAFGQVGPWLERQKDDVVKPRIEKAAQELLSSGGGRLAIVGFCWGGRQALHMADGKLSIAAIVANHPSYTEFPDVFEAISKPVLIQVGTDDQLFPSDQVEGVKEKIFPQKTNASIEVYPEAVHGFTVRSDLNNKSEVQLKEEATVKALEFLQKHLS